MMSLVTVVAAHHSMSAFALYIGIIDYDLTLEAFSFCALVRKAVVLLVQSSDGGLFTP